MTNQTTRVLELLKRFNTNQKVCIESLQNDILWEDKNGKPLSEKTIRRDLDVLKEVFPESFELIRGGENGCYKAITVDSFKNFLNKDTLALMVRTFSLLQYHDRFDTLDMDSDDKRILEKKVKEFKAIYLFKDKPFEHKLASKTIYTTLEKAIYYKQRVLLQYNGKELALKPYKIVFMNENFYLASELEHSKYIFSFLRISKIKEVKKLKENFYHHSNIDKFIKHMQTPMAKYSEYFEEKMIEVIVEVSPKKAQYFKDKKYIRSQKLEEEKDDGSLLLSFKVTQTLEIEELVKRWIPHLKILKPLKLKKKILKEFCLYCQE